MDNATSRIGMLLVSPEITFVFCRNVVAERIVATIPPTKIEKLIKCDTDSLRTSFERDSSAISLAKRVWTATATASHICVVANPSWKVKL